jgi:hypothetical protein
MTRLILKGSVSFNPSDCNGLHYRKGIRGPPVFPAGLRDCQRSFFASWEAQKSSNLSCSVLNFAGIFWASSIVRPQWHGLFSKPAPRDQASEETRCPL